jgi:hypothetical protein
LQQADGFITSFSSASTVGNIGIGCITDTIFGGLIFRKYSSSGTTILWEKCFPAKGDTNLFYYVPLANGDVITAGEVQYHHGTHWFISRKHASGSIAWFRHYGPDSNFFMGLNDMAIAPDGGFFLGGAGNGNNGDVPMHYGNYMQDDFWILKLDSNGNKVWSKVVGGTGDDYPLAGLTPTPDGGAYFVGRTFSNDYDCTGLHNSPQTSPDAYVGRLDGSGNLKWHKCLGGSGGDGGYAAQLGGNGGVFVGATTSSSDGDVHGHIGQLDYWLLGLDSLGIIQWENCYGSVNGNEEITRICRSTSGDIWAIGSSDGYGGQVDTNYGQDDVWVVRADSQGTFKGGRVLGSSGHEANQCIVPLASGMAMAFCNYQWPDGNMPAKYLPSDLEREVVAVRLAPWNVGIENLNANDQALHIYPNPASRKVTITLSARVGDCDLIIRDNLGKEIYNIQVRNQRTIEIDISSLASGLYNIFCKNGGVIYGLEKLSVIK